MKFRKTRMIINYLSVTVMFLFLVSVCSISWSAGGSQVEKLQSVKRGKRYKGKYNFSTDWFSQHIPIWARILEHYKGKPDVHYLEVGVYEGRAFIWMLENILTHPTAKATGVDIFPGDLKIRFERNVKKSGFADKVKVIKGGSQIVLRDLPINSFDIIYIDGDHSAPAVLSDAVLSWLLLKEGGILIFDDYRYKLKERAPEERPKISIDAFASSYREYLDTLSVARQFIIRKNERIGWESF